MMSFTLFLHRAWLVKSAVLVQSMGLLAFHAPRYHRCFAVAKYRLHSPPLIARSSFSNGDVNAAPPIFSPPSASADDVGPWHHPLVLEHSLKRRSRSNNKARFRQHVNPLAVQYQKHCDIPRDWPGCAFQDSSKPLHVDIGCGKGGFLIDLVESSKLNSTDTPLRRNYLGLEIRPLVAQYARDRIHKREVVSGCVDVVGCNANVDLGRLLEFYAKASMSGSAPVMEMVTIQFPDPHFKKSHAKRRVVTPSLVSDIARFLHPLTGQVFLQSDIKSVLDDMRQQFANAHEYFVDAKPPDAYYESNIFGVSTEREESVITRGLPVYRALFTRTSKPFD